MPISSFNKGNKWQQIQGDDITAAISAAVQVAGPSIGFNEADIRARPLRTGGAMALLMEQVDPDTIRLVGRWQGDTMIHCLHTT